MAIRNPIATPLKDPYDGGQPPPGLNPEVWAPSPLLPDQGPKPMPQPAINLQTTQGQAGIPTTTQPAPNSGVTRLAGAEPVSKSPELGGNIPIHGASPVTVAAPRPVQSSLITGNEVPVAIQPQRSDAFQSLLSGVQGTIGTAQTQANKAVDEWGRLTPEMQAALAQSQGGVDELMRIAGDTSKVDPIANPTMQSILARLANPAARTGEQNQVFDQLKQIVARQVANPSIYDDELMTSSIDLAKNRLGESYDASRSDLEADMARRGLSFSSTMGGKLSDMKVSKERSFQEMLNNILREKATANAADRTAAYNMAGGLSDRLLGESESLFNRDTTAQNQGMDMSRFQQSEQSRVFGEKDSATSAAMNNARLISSDEQRRQQAQASAFQQLLGLGGLQGQAADQLGRVESGERDEQRMERGYTDGLRRQARSDSIEEILLEDQLYGSQDARDLNWAELSGRQGSSSAGQAGLGGAGNMFGGLADIYARAQAGDEEAAAEFAQLMMSSPMMQGDN